MSKKKQDYKEYDYLENQTITDDFFESYFEDYNLGDNKPTKLIFEGLLRIATDQHNGYSLNKILHKLQYIETVQKKEFYSLTKLGKKVLFLLYNQQSLS